MVTTYKLLGPWAEAFGQNNMFSTRELVVFLIEKTLKLNFFKKTWPKHFETYTYCRKISTQIVRIWQSPTKYILFFLIVSSQTMCAPPMQRTPYVSSLPSNKLKNKATIWIQSWPFEKIDFFWLIAFLSINNLQECLFLVTL